MSIRLHYISGDVIYSGNPPILTAPTGAAQGTIQIEDILSSSASLDHWDLVFSYGGNWYYWEVSWAAYTCSSTPAPTATATRTPTPTATRTPTPTSTPSPTDFSYLDGKAVIYANDGQYLGKITSNSFDSDSIINDFGTYGSSFSAKSIRNQFGSYGGQFAAQSPFNEFTTTPPKVFLDGQFVAYLTVNQFKLPRIEPLALIAWLQSRS